MKVITSFQEPIWQDVDKKDRIVAKASYSDDTISVISFPAVVGNPEYDLFIQSYSTETIDANTQALRDKQAEERQKSIALQEERALEKRSTILFNAKIEAFEVPAVQRASSEWKAAIRKAKTTVEVIAIAAALISKEGILLDDGTSDQSTTQ